MQIVNMSQASTTLSRLVEAIESGEEAAIIIARDGRPAAKLVPVDAPQSGPRIGVARGKFVVPDSIDTCNEEVTKLFHDPGTT